MRFTAYAKREFCSCDTLASPLRPLYHSLGMNILGLSAFYHDSAACLVRDGCILAAAQQERFSRVKHDWRFPADAVRYCLSEGGIGPADVDYVAFYDKPLLKFDRLLETYLATAPRGFRSFLKAMPLWLRQKLHLPREIERGLGGRPRHRIVFTEHHESHAASAFFPSPFRQAAILTMDGVGEWATASFGHGRGNRIELTHELRFPHSLGLLYSAFTYFTGFRVNSGEYKLMGLAPYGETRFRDLILDRVVDLKADGSFRLNMGTFTYCHGLRMTGRRFADLFGGPRRKPESPLTQREMDLAASIQAVTEEIMLRTARHVRRQTGLPKLVLAGGVALNCVANGRLLREAGFEDLWIQPASGDAGGAVGAALFVWHQLLGHPREADDARDAQGGSLLGPAYGSDEVARAIQALGAVGRRYGDEDELLDRVADLIADGKVVGHFHGRMEFGPRALGSRSILGDPRSPKMQSLMNRKIKFRESFRPFAPSVLRDHAHEYFDVPPGHDSPYMLLVAGVREDQRRPVEGDGADLAGVDRLLKAVRSTIPAVTHVDCSARLQTVDPERHGRYWRLIERFREKTGCPLVVNTSFNVRGEPIVRSPVDAYRCFMATDMDALVLEDTLLLKDAQPEGAAVRREEHLEQFALD